jgi:hypothetical protein
MPGANVGDGSRLYRHHDRSRLPRVPTTPPEDNPRVDTAEPLTLVPRSSRPSGSQHAWRIANVGESRSASTGIGRHKKMDGWGAREGLTVAASANVANGTGGAARGTARGYARRLSLGAAFNRNQGRASACLHAEPFRRVVWPKAKFKSDGKGREDDLRAKQRLIFREFLGRCPRLR